MTQRTLSHGGYGPSTEPGQGLEAINVRTRFDYIFRGLAEDPNCRLPESDTVAVRKNLERLGEIMAMTGSDKGTTESIPAGYTYFGQFIDHDITLNDLTPVELAHNDIVDEFQPMLPSQVTTIVVNLRRPALDLDSVFGDGPDGDAAEFYGDGFRLKMGKNPQVPKQFGVTPPDASDLDRDILRTVDGAPVIGDGRNDENLIVAQLHVGFMRFYNAVIEKLQRPPESLAGDALLEKAFRLARWHYQWLVINDYLTTIAMPTVVREVLDNQTPRLFDPPLGSPFMPLEFSVAAFRFGHSMVRSDYDLNRNFGRKDENDPIAPQPQQNRATLNNLFEFTGAGGRARPNLPNNWIVEWDRLFKKDTRADLRDGRFARKIDAGLALELSTMLNQPAGLMKHLAKRNLLRGYLFSLPTGQCVADAIGQPRMTDKQLTQGMAEEDAQFMSCARFLDRTPLWYYILKEAEVLAGGESLGPVGSRIVAETLIGLIRSDPSSYLNSQEEFLPETSIIKIRDEQPIMTIMDLLKFAGVA